MRNYRSLFATLLVFTATILFSSCEKDDKGDETTTPVQTPSGNTIVSENITENTTWTSNNIYQLSGRISVLSGVTLTIEPGTIIKGEAGTGSNATALLVARGAKLLAEGTPDLPIIFTSVADEIKPADVESGNFASPNLSPSANGFWGGVIILGNAPISAANTNSNNISEVQIEGIPTSDENGLYGGGDPADNSGIFQYVSIRHGGTNIGAGNEINGLTLGGVGSGTVINHIEIVGNQDDGVEWFGGTVNVNNLSIWNAGDDAIDTDQAWSGSLTNFVVLAPTGHCFELDGPEGQLTGSHIIQQGSVKASEVENGNLLRLSEDLINVDENSMVELHDIYFTSIQDGQKINSTTAPDVLFDNISLDVPQELLNNYVNGDIPNGITTGMVPQADIAPLQWTWAAQAGQYNGL